MHTPKIAWLAMTLFAMTSQANEFSDSFEQAPTTVKVVGSETSGVVTSTKATLTNSATTACERQWTVHLLAVHRGRQMVPNAMYHAACTTDKGEHKMFTSMTVKPQGVKRDGYDQNTGMIIESVLKNGKMTPTGVTRAFPECEEMHGITANQNCSVVGALCRNNKRITGGEDFKKDLLAEYPNEEWRNWFTQAIDPQDSDKLKANKQTFDTEWLYEWSSGDISTNPDRYVLHKGIGNWNLGRQDLVFSNTENSYGAYMKTAVGQHDGDTFMVIDRKDGTLNINPQRGWKHSCGAGHTIFNHAVFNPTSGLYAGICGTDAGAVTPYEGEKYGGLWVSVERPNKVDGTEQGFLSIIRKHRINDKGEPVFEMDFAGGVTSMLPMKDGGFLGAYVATKGEPKTTNFYQTGPATHIGLARFDKDGKATKLAFILGDDDWFYTSPQLASLGNGTYLLGFAKTAKLSSKDTLKVYGDAVRLPSSFHVVEIDESGKTLTKITDVKHGWGDQDRMVTLGDGKVAWAYIPDPAYKTATEGDKAKLPSCEASDLSFNVYQSK